EGTTYRYRAALSREKATGTLLRDFLTRFFHGSAAALVLGLVDSRALSPNDLREIESKLNTFTTNDQPDTGKNARKKAEPTSARRRRGS
ncbi:MAG TPA: BlaI/MecI/CopY family transcriptional regulator, partial [Gemmataceae bacterium]|nr:BlaI/MecI/CopY family transcriptional regulator [Gemmataceae bacterium]